MEQPDLLCSNCNPPHAYREHAKICQMASCPCRGFIELKQDAPLAPEPQKTAPPNDGYGLI